VRKPLKGRRVGGGDGLPRLLPRYSRQAIATGYDYDRKILPLGVRVVQLHTQTLDSRLLRHVYQTHVNHVLVMDAVSTRAQHCAMAPQSHKAYAVAVSRYIGLFSSPSTANSRTKVSSLVLFAPACECSNSPLR